MIKILWMSNILKNIQRKEDTRESSNENHEIHITYNDISKKY